MYIATRITEAGTPENSNEGAVGEVSKNSQDHYSQVRLSLGNGTKRAPEQIAPLKCSLNSNILYIHFRNAVDQPFMRAIAMCKM